jgi:site-specific recombinase XerD
MDARVKKSYLEKQFMPAKSLLFLFRQSLVSFNISGTRTLLPHTVKAYERDLAAFFEYQQVTYQATGMAEINHSMIRSWLVSLMESNIKPRSVNRKISSLKPTVSSS